MQCWQLSKSAASRCTDSSRASTLKPRVCRKAICAKTTCHRHTSRTVTHRRRQKLLHTLHHVVERPQRLLLRHPVFADGDAVGQLGRAAQHAAGVAEPLQRARGLSLEGSRQREGRNGRWLAEDAHETVQEESGDAERGLASDACAQRRWE